MLNEKGIWDGYNLNNQIPVVSKPSVLFTVLFEAEKEKYMNYLGKKEVKLVKEVAGTRIYRQILEPKVAK